MMQFLTEGETRTGQGQQIKSLEAHIKFVKLPWDTVDLGQLAILPTTNTEKITQDIALLFAVDFGHILVRAHRGNKLVAVSFLKIEKNILICR